jgi:hypothetical protein
MRFLIVSTEYPAFIQHLYQRAPGLARRSYAEQLEARTRSLFGIAPFYASNLRDLGHDAQEVCANNLPLQRAWARDHGERSYHLRLEPRLRRGFVPWIHLRLEEASLYGILARQIQRYRPDVVLNLDLHLRSSFFREVRGHAFVVGQHASPIPRDLDVSAYDLLVSSGPQFVDQFRSMGARSELLRLGFEERLLGLLAPGGQEHAVGFVGNLTAAHTVRRRWLEEVCAEADVTVWGDFPGLDARSAIWRHRRPPVWGREMYEVLARTRIVLNCHTDVSGRRAGNLRLYEATGVGSLLLTDAKDDLGEMFDPEREVLTYGSAAECVEKIGYFLTHADEASAIAAAGQRRTLRDHTFRQRMTALLELLSRYV